MRPRGQVRRRPAARSLEPGSRCSSRPRGAGPSSSRAHRSSSIASARRARRGQRPRLVHAGGQIRRATCADSTRSSARCRIGLASVSARRAAPRARRRSAARADLCRRAARRGLAGEPRRSVSPGACSSRLEVVRGGFELRRHGARAASSSTSWRSGCNRRASAWLRRRSASVADFPPRGRVPGRRSACDARGVVLRALHTVLRARAPRTRAIARARRLTRTGCLRVLQRLFFGGGGQVREPSSTVACRSRSDVFVRDSPRCGRATVATGLARARPCRPGSGAEHLVQSVRQLVEACAQRPVEPPMRARRRRSSETSRSIGEPLPGVVLHRFLGETGGLSRARWSSADDGSVAAQSGAATGR